MKKNFVEFLSPGTFFNESTEKAIDTWDTKKAMEMAKTIFERHGSRPYGFRFLTRYRGEQDLDSKIIETSGIYFLGGKIRTYDEVVKDNLPNEDILRSNMKSNNFNAVIENNNSWKYTGAFTKNDTLLDFSF